MLPLEIIDQIGRHCPRAINTYILCLGHMDEKRSLILSKEEVTKDLSESFCKFKNDLRALAREGILEWHEMNSNLHIIVGITEENMGDNEDDV